MSKWLSTLAVLCITSVLAAQEPAKLNPAQSLLGMNLSGIADWNSELPFVDVFKTSRPWISQSKGHAWGQGPALDLDENGWVKKLLPDCSAETPMCTGMEGHYPKGKWVVLYDGEGRLDISGGHKVLSSDPGRLVFEPDVSRGGFFLRLAETNPSNYVRNIRVLMPGTEETCKTQPFNPTMMNRWRGMNTIRFMDWMSTNGSKIAKWSDRPRIDNATFSGRGVPVEVMVDLCNRLDANAWFCMPHLADDEYVREFAACVKANLKPSLKVYIEYSNEVWNSMFEQTRWCGDRGLELKLHDKHWEAGWRFYSRRSVRMFDIWEKAFGGRERLVRVIGSQCVPYISEVKLSFEGTDKKCDALAIAPYMGFNVPAKADKPGKLDAAAVSQWTVDQLLDHVEQKVLPDAIKAMQDQKKVADKHGAKLICYEAGQHLVGVGGGENNEQMTKLFHAANRHARMGEIYRKYFDAWKQTGGGVMCVFSSTGKWSKWGSWGVSEYSDEMEQEQPKLRAVIQWNASHRVAVE